jgi:hypothetical protein
LDDYGIKFKAKPLGVFTVHSPKCWLEKKSKNKVQYRYLEEYGTCHFHDIVQKVRYNTVPVPYWYFMRWSLQKFKTEWNAIVLGIIQFNAGIRKYPP